MIAASSKGTRFADPSPSVRTDVMVLLLFFTQRSLLFAQQWCSIIADAGMMHEQDEGRVSSKGSTTLFQITARRIG